VDNPRVSGEKPSGAVDSIGTYVPLFLLRADYDRLAVPVADRLTAPVTVAPSAPQAIVPPQNLEAEESVLGAMLLSATAIGAVTEVLDAADFYRDSHGTIYRAALALYGKGEPVDAITLANELDERSELERVGGTAAIAELAAVVPATSNAEHYARIVKEMATLRGLVRVGQEIQRLGQTRPGETTDLVDRAEQLVFELAQARVSGDFAHIHDLLNESFARIMHLYEAGVDVTGVPSGFRELDKLTSGFQPGNLIIVAARPSMGKSALALCAAANLAVRHETPVALFTLEMSKAEVTQRLMCSEARVESQRLRSGRLAQEDWPRLTAACDTLMKAPIYVDDTGSITMMELRSKARRLKSREPKLGLIIVDYLQLMTSGSNPENRVQEVSQISRQLKVLARDLEVPILALSQLSRAVEQRHDKRPILSDLRESGSIEQDADLVAFVYRDEYYNGEESDSQGLAEIILAKHRNGPTDAIKLSFLKRYAKFTDMAASS
jgi:replicative DNA helicase